jgi:hypothetical protein
MPLARVEDDPDHDAATLGIVERLRSSRRITTTTATSSNG